MQPFPQVSFFFIVCTLRVGAEFTGFFHFPRNPKLPFVSSAALWFLIIGKFLALSSCICSDGGIRLMFSCGLDHKSTFCIFFVFLFGLKEGILDFEHGFWINYCFCVMWVLIFSW